MSPTDIKFTADQVKFIHNALICYKEHFESRAGQKMYSLKIRKEVLHWKHLDGVYVDSRIYHLQQYETRLKKCSELLELITTEPCT